jgi:hypothetical protein
MGAISPPRDDAEARSENLFLLDPSPFRPVAY